MLRRAIILVAFLLICSSAEMAEMSDGGLCVCTGGNIIPFPRRATYHDRYWDLPKGRVLILLGQSASGQEKVAARELRERLAALLGPEGNIDIVSTNHPNQPFELVIRIGTLQSDPDLRQLTGGDRVFGHAPTGVRDEEYLIRFIDQPDAKTVLCVGAGPRGCYFAAQSLLHLFEKASPAAARIRLAEVDDWPSFTIRSTSVFRHTDGLTEKEFVEALTATRWLGLAKFNTVNVHYLTNRHGSWRNPPSEYRRYAWEATIWARERGLNVIDFINPFFGEATELSATSKIVISSAEEIDALVNSYRCTFDHGANMAMLCMDDFVPSPFPPYRLTNEADRRRFGDLGEATIFLIRELQQRLRELSPEPRLFWCPPWFCTWMLEETKRKQGVEIVRRVSRGIPEDVGIVWTGPAVRSKTITVEEVEKWKRYVAREKPFLWDNTFYERRKNEKHIGVHVLCDLFETRYPDSFWRLVDGGIHFNNASNDEIARIGLLDLGNYLWNPESYDAQGSLRACIQKVAGPNAVEAVFTFRETYYDLFEIFPPEKWRKKKDIPALAASGEIAPPDVERMRKLAVRLKTDLDQVQAVSTNARLVEALRKQAQLYTDVIDYEVLAEQVGKAQNEMEQIPEPLSPAHEILREIREKDWEQENDPTLLWRLCRRLEAAIYGAQSGQPEIDGYEKWLEQVRWEVGRAASDDLTGQARRNPDAPGEELWTLMEDRYATCPLSHRLDLEIFAQQAVFVPRSPTEYYSENWKGSIPAPIEIKTASDSHGRHSISDDCTVSLGFFWTDEQLYVAVSVQDSSDEAVLDGGPFWRQDSVQIAIDPRFNPYDNPEGYGEDDVEVGAALVNGEVSLQAWKTPGVPPAEFIEQTAVAAQKEGNRIDYYFAFPWATLLPGSQSVPRMFGLSVLVNDWDGENRASVEWGGGIADKKNPRQFRVLIPVDRT